MFDLSSSSRRSRLARLGAPTILLAAVSMHLVVAAAWAQTPTTANLSGYVYDTDGAPLPGVTVVLRGTERDVSFTRVTDRAGYFVFPALAPGTYSIELSLQGFQDLAYRGIVAGPNARLRFEYEMGPDVAVTETVMVTASAPAIETTEPAIKSTITYNQFDDLPVLSRNFQDIVDTLPGVTKNGANFNVGGSRDNQNIFLIDGARNNDLTGTSERFRNSLYFIIGSQNAEDPTVGLQTGFNLQSFNQDAISEIQLVSSAYSAEFGQGSGGVINLITKSGTDAWGGGFTFNLQDEGLNSDNSFEELKRYQESAFAGGPIRRGSTWFFGSYERDDYRVGFDRRRIALPGEPTGGRIRSFALDLDVPQSDTARNRFTGKVTSQLGTANLLNVTLNYSDDTSDFNSAINRPSPDQVEPRHGNNDTFSVLVNDFHTFENESYLYSLFKYSRVDRVSTSDLGINGAQPLIYTAGPSGPVFTDFFVIGAFGELIDAQLDAFEWKEAYTLFTGDHSVKLGFDWERFNEDLSVPARELFVSDNIAPDGTVVPVQPGTSPPPEALFTFFSTGTPIDQRTEATLNTFSTFVQDDWNVTPQWTLSLGLRYDYDDFLENHELSPRAHMIYALTDRLVLRAGAGVFRDRSTLLATEELTLVRSRGISYDKATGLPLSDPSVLPDQNVFLTDGFSSPVTYEGNVGMEYNLGADYVVGANFIYKDFDDLVWTKIINEPPLSGPAPDPTIPANSKLIGNFGLMRDAIVELTFRKRFTDGGYFNANYTFEDTEGNTSQELAARKETVIDNFQEAPDQETLRHPADYEVRHAFKLSGVYYLPFDVDVSSILKWRTGRPWTVEERIAMPRAHFIAPEGVNTRNLPAEFQWDLRAAKAFAFGRHTLEAYLDVFNVTNHENVRSVQAIATFANFADPTSFGLPRTLQLGFKYRF